MHESTDIVWMQNKHGVKFTRTKEEAEKIMSTKMGYTFCEAEFVPEEKQFLHDSGLTKKAQKERQAMAEKPIKEEVEVEPVVEIEEEAMEVYDDYSMKELRGMAKDAGINSFGKSRIQLIEMLEVKFESEAL